MMQRRSGFTLIELLVIVSILGLIFGLLVPAVQQVRCSARMTACLSNIRQLGMACVMYEQDYDALPGSLSKLQPYKRSMYADSSDSIRRHLSFIKLAHAQYPPLPPYYQHEEGILVCPESPELGTQGYALNEKVVGKKLAEVNNARCILMGDYAGGSSTLLIESIDHLGFRHCRENRANVFFANMTTESLRTDEVTQSNLEPEEDPNRWYGTWGYFSRLDPSAISPPGGNPRAIFIEELMPSRKNEKDQLEEPYIGLPIELDNIKVVYTYFDEDIEDWVTLEPVIWEWVATGQDPRP